MAKFIPFIFTHEMPSEDACNLSTVHLHPADRLFASCRRDAVGLLAGHSIFLQSCFMLWLQLSEREKGDFYLYIMV